MFDGQIAILVIRAYNACKTIINTGSRKTSWLIPAIANMLASGLYVMVSGSLIYSKGVLKRGNQMNKYISNRLLTLLQNILTWQKHPDCHTVFKVANMICYAKHFEEDTSSIFSTRVSNNYGLPDASFRSPVQYWGLVNYPLLRRTKPNNTKETSK